MRRIEAKEIAHTLSNPSKMPGRAYSLPATECKVGGRLQNVAGSTCENCYAMRGAYVWRPTREAMAKRLAAIEHPQWVEAMVVMVRGQEWFRWHDSGDLQSVQHLARIVEICEQTPETRHWLPTREKAIVREYLRAGGSFPENLVVRLSAAMVDGEVPAGFEHTSTVHHQSEAIGHECPAPSQGNACQDCRACWDRNVSNVSYRKH